MKLKAVNNLDFMPSELEFGHENFKGHQKGVFIGLQDVMTKEILENHLPESLGTLEERNQKLLELIDDNSVLLVREGITQLDGEDNHLANRFMWYLPYYVENHSIFKPTVNYDNVNGDINYSHEIDVELCLVHDNLTRYLTVRLQTINVPIFECINDLFECTADEDFTAITGIHYVEEDETEQGECGYLVEFYNEAGDLFQCIFNSIERIKNCIVSMRLIGINTTRKENK